MNLSQYESQWKCIGCLANANLTPYNHCVGLYKHVVNGEIMYIGRAIELYNGGFRKRLSDYTRDSDSARKHSSGQIIHQNMHNIQTYILIVGYTDDAVEKTKLLEKEFIKKYRPRWNTLYYI